MRPNDRDSTYDAFEVRPVDRRLVEFAALMPEATMLAVEFTQRYPVTRFAAATRELNTAQCERELRLESAWHGRERTGKTHLIFE